MYCSTCGARIPVGRRACDTCGTPVAPRARAELPVPSGAGRGAPARALAACPRCGYQGEGLPYFARGGHVAALVAATVLTAGAMGAGGLVYYLARRDHRVCPRCGRGWGRQGEHSLAPRRSHAPDPAPVATMGAGGERVKRGWSWLLFVMAAFLLVGGLVELEAAAIAFGLAAAGGGVWLQRAADRDREARRAALIASLQLPVLKLAAQRGGRLTVTQVAAELGWTLRRAEKVLQSLDDGLRVDSEVTDEGVIEYHFRELLPGPAAGPERPRLPDPEA